jgi:hypothetical protein
VIAKDCIIKIRLEWRSYLGQALVRAPHAAFVTAHGSFAQPPPPCALDHHTRRSLLGDEVQHHQE